MPAIDTRPKPRPRTRTTSVWPVRPTPGPGTRRSLRLPGFVLEDNPGAALRRGALTCGRLLLSHLDRIVGAFDGPSDRLLPGALDGVGDAEQAADQCLDPRQRPPLARPAVDQRGSDQLSFQPGDLGLAEPGPPRRTLRQDPNSPRSRQARRHRSTERPLTRTAAAISLFVSPPPTWSTICNRIRSRAALSASVRPPPCA